jgi:hypothetical protein
MLKPGEHVAQAADAFFHDLLSGDERNYVEEHCRVCNACQAAVAEARQRLEMLRALPAFDVPEEVLRATQQQLIRQGRSQFFSPRRLSFMALAAAAVVLGILDIHYLRMQATPYDLVVLGQNQWLCGSEASLRIVLRNQQTNAPVPGVPVEVELLEQSGHDHSPPIHLADFTTDAAGSGSPRFRVPERTDCRYELRVRAGSGAAAETIARPLAIKRPLRLLLATDKPAYQPGETLHLRLLGMDIASGKWVAGQQAEFTLSNPQGDVIFRHVGATSRFGIAAIDCPLVDDLPAGTYQARGRVNEVTAETVVQVKKYTPPTVTVDVTFDRPFYQVGQTIRGTVRAADSFGKPLDNARVALLVETAEAIPRTIEETVLHTAADGHAAFQSTVQAFAGASEAELAEVPLRVTATVFDAADEKHTNSVSRVLATQGIRVDVLPEAGTLVAGVTNRVYFFTSYPDGRPARTRIVVAGLDREFATSALGVAVWEGVPDASSLSWVLRASDEAGNRGRRRVVLPCGNAPADFLLRTDRAVYDSGQTMRISLFAAEPGPLLIDLIQAGQTIRTDSVALDNGRGELEYALSAELGGTFQLCAYRCAAHGIGMRKSRTVYVRPAGKLQLQATADRPEYQPGGRARLHFSVTDAEGQPAPGAIDLCGVDQSLASQLQSRQDAQATYFSLDSQLLRPVRALYPWSPQPGGTADDAARAQFEQALFSRTAVTDWGMREFLHDLVGKYANDKQNILDVLEEPDWQRLARGQHLPDDVIGMLGGESGVYSLAARSYPGKATFLDKQRKTGLAMVQQSWIGMALAAAIALGAILLRFNPLGCVVAVLIAVVLLYILYWPYTTRSELTRGAEIINSTRCLVTVFEEARKNGDLDAWKPAAESPAPPDRRWFAQQTNWQPELITDDAGHADLELQLPDTAVDRQLAAGVVSAAGKVGATATVLAVRQSYKADVDLPPALDQGDAVAVSVAIVNQLSAPRNIRVALGASPGVECRDSPERLLKLASGELGRASYWLRARRPGHFELQWEVQDGPSRSIIRRPLEIAPLGKRVEEAAGGALQSPAEIAWHVPGNTVPGTLRAVVKIYPSDFSQLIDCLQTAPPASCDGFAQRVSSLYPAVLVLDHLQRQGLHLPQIEGAARAQLQLGYQRLLNFQSPGGGFGWFEQSPADPLLTAYGLRALEDIARVYPVDAQLIQRTRQWLLAQQNGDGSWSTASSPWQDDPAHRQLSDWSTTAYIARAVFAVPAEGRRAARTLAHLRPAATADIHDPYVLALVADVLLTLDPSGVSAAAALERLEQQVKRSAGAGEAWWEQPVGQRPLLPSSSEAGKLETTATAVLALRHGKRSPAATAAALNWIARQSPIEAWWHSTPAAVEAWKAMEESAVSTPRATQPQHVRIAMAEKPPRELDLPADSVLPQEVDLTELVATGDQRLSVSASEPSAIRYRTLLSYYCDESADTPDTAPLKIQLSAERDRLAVNERITMRATVSNQMPLPAPMVIVELPIPAGLVAQTEELDAQLSSGKISAYRRATGQLIVCFRTLEPDQPHGLTYVLRGESPAKTAPPLARAYEYYDPAKQAIAHGSPLEVTAKP